MHGKPDTLRYPPGREPAAAAGALRRLGHRLAAARGRRPRGRRLGHRRTGRLWPAGRRRADGAGPPGQREPPALPSLRPLRPAGGRGRIPPGLPPADGGGDQPRRHRLRLAPCRPGRRARGARGADVPALPGRPGHGLAADHDLCLRAQPARRAGQAGAHLARAAPMHLHYQADPGPACPLTMTYAGVPSLRAEPILAREWLPRAVAPHYDPAQRPAWEKAGNTLGMGMTEKQGGSDVRANSTVATPTGDGMYAPGRPKWV